MQSLSARLFLNGSYWESRPSAPGPGADFRLPRLSTLKETFDSDTEVRASGCGVESDDRLRTTLRVLRQTTRRNETDTFA